MLTDKQVYPALAVITGLYLIVGTLYAINTPPWQAPDEPAHYNVIAQLTAEGCCPVITGEDWNAAYLDELKAERFPPGADITGITYEDHQPPLYYIALMPLFRLTGGSLIALRLASVAFGAGVVLAAYFVAARLFPEQRMLALATAVFTAFVPQHVAILASVNNDSLALMVLGILLVVIMGYLRNPVERDSDGRVQPLYISKVPHAAALGGLVGVAYLTKLTVYLPATLAVAAAILARWRIERESIGWLAREVAWAAGLAILFGLPFWVRNAVVYGFPDIFALAAHDAAVVGQLRTAEYIAANGFGVYVGDLLRVTFRSYWGQFGWMAVPLPPREYLVIGAFLLVTAVGWGHLYRFRDRLELHRVQRAGLLVLLLVALASFANYIVYNLTYLQLQGRYLFTLMIPFGVLIGAGWVGWMWALQSWLKAELRALVWLPPVVMLWLPLFALWALVRHVIPNL